MSSNKFFRVRVDIFSVPLEYKTEQARYENYIKLCQKLYNLGIDDGYKWSQWKIGVLVKHGLLSLVSASYFLSGRTTPEQEQFLTDFMNFVEFGLGTYYFKFDAKCLELWQKQENEVPENTFLFPLAELASKDEDFISERERFLNNDVLDLKEI